jgi:hypothetical protein
VNAIRAWFLRLLFGDDPYPPEAAEAPDIVARAYEDAGDTFGFQRAVPFVEGDHPKDCADECCFAIRMQELVDADDWNAAELAIVRPWRGQAR